MVAGALSSAGDFGWLNVSSVNTHTHTHAQGRCSLSALSSSEQVRVWAQTCPASQVGQANQNYRCVPLCVCLCTSCFGCNGRCDTLPPLFVEFTSQIQTHLHQTIPGSGVLWTGWIEMGLSCLLHDWKPEDRTDIGVQRHQVFLWDYSRKAAKNNSLCHLLKTGSKSTMNTLTNLL